MYVNMPRAGRRVRGLRGKGRGSGRARVRTRVSLFHELTHDEAVLGD